MSPVAIVTASDSGIGQESAKELAENGFDVGITYRTDEAGAQETLEAVEAAGRRGEVRRLDLTELPRAADVIDVLADSLGGVDLPLGRPGHAREIAAWVTFLASEKSTYATGASFVVDGGLMLMAAELSS
jgi:NAD(P)-dependent dehydrogenase (short-subunit alcohol dehydrogenase family)